MSRASPPAIDNGARRTRAGFTFNAGAPYWPSPLKTVFIMSTTAAGFGGLPFPWEQLLQFGDGDFGDTRQDTGKPSLRIDVVKLRRHDECGHDGGAIHAPIGSGDESCFSAESEAAQRSQRSHASSSWMLPLP
jgi:hypothetical protein